MSTAAEAVLVLFGGCFIFVVIFHKSVKCKFVNETFCDALIKLLVNYFCLMGKIMSASSRGTKTEEGQIGNPIIVIL